MIAKAPLVIFAMGVLAVLPNASEAQVGRRIQLPGPSGARVALVASGGGIRAAFGTLLALEALEKSSVIDDIQDFYGLSGGAWGLSMWQHSGGNAKAVVDGITSTPGYWGYFGAWSKYCGERYWGYFGRFSDSCHMAWRRSIKDALFDSAPVRKVDVGRNFSISAQGKQVDIGKKSKKRTITIMIDRCNEERVETNTIMNHTHQCALENEHFLCVHLDTLEDTEFQKRKTWVTRDRKSNTWVQADAYDWLTFTSSAWAESGKETSKKTRGWLNFHKPPAQVQLETKSGEKVFTRLCDSGARCNIPLFLLNQDKSRAHSRKVHKLIVLDFSDDSSPLESWNKCMNLHWSKILKNLEVEDKSFTWGQEYVMTGKVGSVWVKVVVDYIQFRGKSAGEKLIKEFPTMDRKKDPTYYNSKAIGRFKAEWGTYITELVRDKTGPFHRNIGSLLSVTRTDRSEDTNCEDESMSSMSHRLEEDGQPYTRRPSLTRGGQPYIWRSRDQFMSVDK